MPAVGQTIRQKFGWSLPFLLLAGLGTLAQADVISVVETGTLEPERSIVENGGDGIFDPTHPGTNVADGALFGEDVLTFTDRTHQHNGAAFDFIGFPTVDGETIVPLPEYLLGHEYVRFANDGRDNVPYSFQITANVDSTFYLLVDNRLNGTAGDTSSPNSSDPDLGGTLSWIVDDGWERVDTGISPEGLPDYTAVDESGDGVGPGVALNQFYSVYKLTGSVVTLKEQGIGGSNNYSCVIVPNGDVPSPLGDANGDGTFDFGDIEAFFLAITDLSAYAAQYPNGVISNLDMNQDGGTDFGDIEAFFQAVTGG